MNFVAKKCSFFKNFDVFGIPVDLTYDSKTKFKSNYSAFASVILFSFSIYIFVRQFIKWFHLLFQL